MKKTHEWIIDDNGKWKHVPTDTPEWDRYYAEMERWRASRDKYKSDFDWAMFEPNKPGHCHANND